MLSADVEMDLRTTIDMLRAYAGDALAGDSTPTPPETTVGAANRIYASAARPSREEVERHLYLILALSGGMCPKGSQVESQRVAFLDAVCGPEPPKVE
jgi:hypothetical protein